MVKMTPSNLAGQFGDSTYTEVFIGAAEAGAAIGIGVTMAGQVDHWGLPNVGRKAKFMKT